MNIVARALVIIAATVLVTGCATPRAEDQIRARLLSIRKAILAEQTDGIFAFGTTDWKFVAPDGQTFDRPSYRERTERLFAAIDIESLQTDVVAIERRDDRAQVRLTQTMVRIETAATGERQRWRVSYDERQEWSYSKERGWLVAIVQVINPRRELLAP
jgi:hypothetical protein